MRFLSYLGRTHPFRPQRNRRAEGSRFGARYLSHRSRDLRAVKNRQLDDFFLHKAYSGSNVSHVGQMLYNQPLHNEIEAIAHRRQRRYFFQEAELGGPVSESSLLGGIRHGIFAGIAFDIDITESYGIGADFLNLIEVTKSVLGGRRPGGPVRGGT